MDMLQYIREYCTGCGLCHSVNGTELEVTDKGFPICKLDSDMDIEFFTDICPVFYFGKENNGIWGKVDKAVVGFAADKQVRFRSASGGALTELASYLLEKKYVDGIIHITYDKTSPTQNEVCMSRTRQEVRDRCGSRYSISSPLENISQMVLQGEKYAIIGKPCDIMALRQYVKRNRDMEKFFPFMLSFFCAGEPSVCAQNNLLEAMGCSIDNCQDIIYRGNGWPGYTTVRTYGGKELKMKYQDAWGGYLGRDVRNICRFCLDGVGEAADIVCADFWFLNDDGAPDFSEHDGRNIIISRNEKGSRLMDEAIREGFLIEESEFTSQMDEFYKYQPHQYKRKATMNSVILALKLCRKSAPKYPQKVLHGYSRCIDNKTRIRYFLGTIKRILQKRI